MADKTAEQPSAALADEVPVAASQLSAMVDNELADMEIDLVLRRLSRDDEARDRWERYHLMSDLIQSHVPPTLDCAFAAHLRQLIEAEPLPQPVAKPLPTWYKPVTGFALAASVALIVLFGPKLDSTDVSQPTLPQVTTSTLRTPATAFPLQTVASTQPTDSAPEPFQTRLNHYLANHHNYASMNGMPGMLPYVRMVGYQTDR